MFGYADVIYRMGENYAFHSHETIVPSCLLEIHTNESDWHTGQHKRSEQSAKNIRNEIVFQFNYISLGESTYYTGFIYKQLLFKQHYWDFDDFFLSKSRNNFAW